MPEPTTTNADRITFWALLRSVIAANVPTEVLNPAGTPNFAEVGMPTYDLENYDDVFSAMVGELKTRVDVGVCNTENGERACSIYKPVVRVFRNRLDSEGQTVAVLFDTIRQDRIGFVVMPLINYGAGNQPPPQTVEWVAATEPPHHRPYAYYDGLIIPIPENPNANP